MNQPGVLARTFAALAVRNFRIYFCGQIVSVSGAWMQRVAQSWLVLEITGSGSMVGALVAAQFFPVLLLAPRGGLLADRTDKRKVLYASQSLLAVATLTLGVLVLAGTVELWMVFGLAVALGLVESVDNPTRQSFVVEIVGRDHTTNAVALNQVLVNAARIVGPAIGGVLIITVGIGWCFVLNSATFAAFIIALTRLRESELIRARPESRLRGQLIEAMRYLHGEPTLFATLVVTAIIGLFAYEFEVVLPLLARFTFAGQADTLGSMFAFMGVGAIGGGLYVASLRVAGSGAVLLAGLALAASMTATAFMPTVQLAYLALVLVGASSSAFLTLSNSVVQLGSIPRMRGRVVGLRAMAVLGVRPIGAPMVGWIGEHFGPRYALGVGAGACVLAVLWARSRLVAVDSI